ncbi:MAG: PRC-barrel domain-containing protein [Paracoccaceae bacterium]|nr:PRC-barrel domain-containing protein [Paracoccaceae bacterium]
MKHLLMTTSLLAFIASPAFAQTQTPPSHSQQTRAEQPASPEQAQRQNQDELALGDTIQASQLIGKRLYMPTDDQAGMQGQSTAPATVPQSNKQNQGSGQNTVQPGASGTVGNDPASNVAGANDSAGMSPQPGDLEMIGEIRDVILNTDGGAEGLIVDSGGFLGMNANRLRVSIEDVRFVPEMQGQSAQERTEPVGDNAQETEFSVVYTGDRAAFEGTEAYDETGATDTGETLGSTTWEQSERQQDQVSLSDITTEELIGAPAYGSENEWLGEVSELSLGQDGEVESVIVDVGGFLGIGEKPVALPMDQVELRVQDGDELRVHINHTEDELDAMETWESDSDL